MLISTTASLRDEANIFRYSFSDSLTISGRRT